MITKKKPKAATNITSVWDWEFLFSVPRCHKWFRCRNSSRVSVADYSGHFPHETDDGVLWLVPNQQIIFREDWRDWYSERPLIWLVNESGEEVLLGGTLRSEAIELVNNRLATLWH